MPEKGGLLKKKTDEKPRVMVVRVLTEETNMKMKTTGRLVPIDRLEVKADRQVKIEKIFVEEGQKVNQGENLVRFADEKHKQRLDFVRAELKEAETAVSDYNHLQQNKERLIEEGKMAEVLFTGLDDRIAHARATLERAREEIKLLEEIENPTVVVAAPFDGLVSKKSATEGSLANKGDSIVEIIKFNPIKLVFQLPVEFVDFMTRETPVKAHFDAIPGREFGAEVQMIGPEINEARMMEIKTTMANDDSNLKPGQSAEVSIVTNRPIKISYIPADAVWEEGGTKYVYRFDGRTLQKVSINIGEKRDNLITVTRGLKEEDVVVVSEREGLSNGMSVDVQLAEVR